MSVITNSNLKDILNNLGENLSYEVLEECIKECLGDDYTDATKRFKEGAGQKEVYSDDERKEDYSDDESKEGDEEDLHITLLRNLGTELQSANDDVIKETGNIIIGAIENEDEGTEVYIFLQEFLPLLKSVAEDPDNEDNRKLYKKLRNTYKDSQLDVVKFFKKKIIVKEEERSIIQHILSNIRLVKGLVKRFTAVLEEIKKSSFGELVRKSTEKVRSIAKKKGIYIIGRKNRKFLGIKFLKSGNYSKKKNKKPNCKEYSYDQIRKMKNTKYKIDWKKSKLPELIDKMNIKDVKQKFGDFQFGFELLPQRGCGSKFGYTIPKGTPRGYGSALLYSQI